MFASSLFYPLQNLPSWFRIAAYTNPMTWQTDVLRYCTLGIGEMRILVFETFAFLVFTVLSFLGAVHAVNHSAE
jgi:ABC-type multidrug transport system permease subunit